MLCVDLILVVFLVLLVHQIALMALITLYKRDPFLIDCFLRFFGSIGCIQIVFEVVVLVV